MLDSRFRVRGVDGLRVVDASIFPRIPATSSSPTSTWRARRPPTSSSRMRRYGLTDTAAYPRELREREVRRRVEARRKNGRSDRRAETARRCRSRRATAVAGRRRGTGAVGRRRSLGDLRPRRPAGLARAALAAARGLPVDGVGRRLHRLVPRALRSTGFGRTRMGRPSGSRPSRAGSRRARAERSGLAGSCVGCASTGTTSRRRAKATTRVNTGHLPAQLPERALRRRALLLVAVRDGQRDPLRDPRSDRAAPSSLLALIRPRSCRSADSSRGSSVRSSARGSSLFELILLFIVLPRMIGYWIVSQDKHGRYVGAGAAAMLFVVVAALLVRGGAGRPKLAGAAHRASHRCSRSSMWKWHGAAGRMREEAIGRGSVETQRLRSRNYLTYDLGRGAGAGRGRAGVCRRRHDRSRVAPVGWRENRVYLDGVRVVHGRCWRRWRRSARFVAGLFAREKKRGPPSTFDRCSGQQLTAGLLRGAADPVPLVFVSFTAHAAYQRRLGALGGRSAQRLLALICLVDPRASRGARLRQSLVARADLRRASRARVSGRIQPAAVSAGRARTSRR